MNNNQKHITALLTTDTGVYASTSFSRYLMITALTVFIHFGALTSVRAQLNTLPPELSEVGIVEKLGERVPGDISLVNENGDKVQIADFLASGKPVIFVPIYFECPMLCSLILNGLTAGLRDLSWTIGDEFEIVTYSINPEEDHELASRKKSSYLRLLGKPEAAGGWHFLTGTEAEVRRLSDALGFQYKWSEEAQEYLHGSAIMFAGADGVITRYLYGIEYTELALRNALFDTANGRIGSFMERVMLFCYTFDPNSGSYVPYALNIMKLGGALTLGFLGVFLGLLWFRNKSTRAIND